MRQYLLSIYQPDGPAPDADTMAVIMADLDNLRKINNDFGHLA